MAYHGPSYGLDAELKAKQSAKYDPAVEAVVIDFIATYAGVQIQPGESNVHAALKDGIVLCNLANKISPGIVKKINAGKMPFVQMENINAFLVALKGLGLKDSDIFMTVDLFEAKNMSTVIQTLFTLKAQKAL